LKIVLYLLILRHMKVCHFCATL